MSSLYLQIFLGADLFVIGLLTPLMFKHGKAHIKGSKQDDEKPHLTEADKERMLRESEVKYQKVLDHSVQVLQTDLDKSAEQINGLVTRFAGVIVGDEMERYRSELSKLHKQAEADMSVIKQEIGGHQTEIEAKFHQEMELEKQRLIAQIDTKLGDAVGSFLVETLQHNVDLGNQTEYLLAMLEEHKLDFSKILTDSEPPEERISSVSAVNVASTTLPAENKSSASLPDGPEVREVLQKPSHEFKQQVDTK
ncbi:MAG: hypothetical protein JWO47_891 [Candidatus Saccharibacteria bacterium]|nr:hypothetical protein [Candidatus Saccharibacteria bacterium]